jgi:hypothetical protein
MRLFAFLAVMFTVSGCAGALGGTKSFVLEIEPRAGLALRHAVAVSSVSYLEEANEVDSVGTYHVGKIGDSEIADLGKSLTDTLEQIAWPVGGSAALGVHLLVTHYYVAHSNNDGGVLASIDWALVSPPNEIVFSEQFFASIQASGLEGINTLGNAKNTPNVQVVRRVVEKSLQLAVDTDRTPVAAVAHTYETAEEAAGPMPQRLTPVLGMPSFSTKGVDWATGAPTKPADWHARLAGR